MHEVFTCDVPLLRVIDNYYEEATPRLVGLDTHDSLFLKEGIISYYNMKNGDGTPNGYRFDSISIYEENDAIPQISLDEYLLIIKESLQEKDFPLKDELLKELETSSKNFAKLVAAINEELNKRDVNKTI